MKDDNIFLWVKAVIAAACGAFTAAFGWLGWLVVAWAACMVLDWLSGSAAAASHALAQMNAPSQSSGATPSRSSRSSACALAAQSRLSSASSSAPQAQMLFAVSRISSSIALPPFASCRR